MKRVDLKKLVKKMKKENPTLRTFECYEILAKEAGFPSWNHYSATLEK
nr:MAG: hypothetical protein [Microvirus sp.]